MGPISIFQKLTGGGSKSGVEKWLDLDPKKVFFAIFAMLLVIPLVLLVAFLFLNTIVPMLILNKHGDQIARQTGQTIRSYSPAGIASAAPMPNIKLR
jgi:hypothetical protein